MTLSLSNAQQAILDRIHRLPRADLGAFLPTPLVSLQRLGSDLGLQLLVKRDDLTGIGTGGNKVRKLEFLMGEAQARGADHLITTGGAQSNHAQLTAACAARAGMGCQLILREGAEAGVRGNLVLDSLLGAEVAVLESDDYFANIDDYMRRAAEEKAEAGRRPYVIPLGGATPVGCLGYILCCAELAEQARTLDLHIDTIIAAVGSCGTLAGLVVGAGIFLPDTRIVGMSVSFPRDRAVSTVADLVEQTRDFIGAVHDMAEVDWDVIDDQIGPGYGRPSVEGVAAIRQVARREALLLDPVYTGKAMAGLLALVERRSFREQDTVVFLHSGGLASIFAFDDL